MNWLIDGQQRVITLARTLSGDEGIEVVFNPREDMFRLANAATRNDRRQAPGVQQSGNAKSLLSMIEEIVKLKPEAELPLAQLKLPALIKLDQQDQALAGQEAGEDTDRGKIPRALT